MICVALMNVGGGGGGGMKRDLKGKGKARADSDTGLGSGRGEERGGSLGQMVVLLEVAGKLRALRRLNSGGGGDSGLVAALVSSFLSSFLNCVYEKLT